MQKMTQRASERSDSSDDDSNHIYGVKNPTDQMDVERSDFSNKNSPPSGVEKKQPDGSSDGR